MPKHSFDHVTDWVFDMDHTLYPANNQLFRQIEVLMSDYTHRATGLPRTTADELRHKYWNDYGASVTGLVEHHGIDAHDFLHHVHQVDFSVLTPDPHLKTEISKLRGRKVVFTNGPKAYASQVLRALDLDDAFDHVCGFEDAGMIPKPQPRAYDTVFRSLGIAPSRAVMFEDSHENLKVPHDLGMKTVLIHANNDGPHVHHQSDCLVSFLRQIG